jgi:hypothetical protein
VDETFLADGSDPWIGLTDDQDNFSHLGAAEWDRGNGMSAQWVWITGEPLVWDN